MKPEINEDLVREKIAAGLTRAQALAVIAAQEAEDAASQPAPETAPKSTKKAKAD